MLGKPSPHIQKARLIKSDTEAAIMRRAGEISGRAVSVAIAATVSGMTERELWSLLEKESIFNGADSLAYPPVVASGARFVHWSIARSIDWLINWLIDFQGFLSLILS